MSDDEETDDPLVADVRNFYKCDITLIEECKPTVWHASDVYRRQAAACRDMHLMRSK